MSANLKFIVALALAVVSAGTAVLAAANGHYTAAVVGNAVIAVLGAVTVYLAKNQAEEAGWWGWQYVKTIVAGLSAAAALVQTYITAGGFQGITLAEWIQVGIAFISTVAVGVLPNRQPAAGTGAARSV